MNHLEPIHASNAIDILLQSLPVETSLLLVVQCWNGILKVGSDVFDHCQCKCKFLSLIFRGDKRNTFADLVRLDNGDITMTEISRPAVNYDRRRIPQKRAYRHERQYERAPTIVFHFYLLSNEQLTWKERTTTQAIHEFFPANKQIWKFSGLSKSNCQIRFAINSNSKKFEGHNFVSDILKYQFFRL